MKYFELIHTLSAFLPFNTLCASGSLLAVFALWLLIGKTVLFSIFHIILVDHSGQQEVDPADYEKSYQNYNPNCLCHGDRQLNDTMSFHIYFIKIICFKNIA